MLTKILAGLAAVVAISLGGYSIYASAKAPAVDCCATHEACCDVNASCCGENYNPKADDCCVVGLGCCDGGACCK